MRPGRLSSWKEIATFLGKDPKTVQRWERQYGLPVHRVPGSGHGSVFAFSDELRAWLLKGDPANAWAEEAEKSELLIRDQPVTETRVAQDQPHRLAWSRRRLLLAGGTSVGALGLAALLWRRGDGPEAVEITGRVVTAFDARRRELWQFRLPEAPEVAPPTSLNPTVTLVDLDGSGKNSVLIRAYYPHESSEARAQELICLNWRGAIRWRHELEPELLDFDGKPFTPAWGSNRILVTGKGDRKDVWCAVVHQFRWASCLWKIDVSGKRTIQFYSHGHIASICPFERDGRLVLALGGIDSSVDHPFIAVVDPEGPPVASPPSDHPRYHYSNEPSSIVREYVILPEMEIDRFFRTPYFYIYHIDYEKPVITVSAEYPDIDHPEENVPLYYFEFTDRLVPLRVRVDHREPLTHAAMEHQGIVHHSHANCPERQKPLPLLRWSEGQWKSDSIPWALAGNTV